MTCSHSSPCVLLVAGKLTRERITPDLKEKGDISKDLKNIIGSCVVALVPGFLFTNRGLHPALWRRAYYFKYYATPGREELGMFQVVRERFFTLGTIAALLGVIVFTSSQTIDRKKMTTCHPLVGSYRSTSTNPKQNITTIIATQMLSHSSRTTAAILFAMYTDMQLHSQPGASASNAWSCRPLVRAEVRWAIGGSLTSIRWVLLATSRTSHNQHVQQIMRFI